MGAEGEQGQQLGQSIQPFKEGQAAPRPNLINEAQFLTWKRRKDAVASAKKTEAARKRAEDVAAGTVQMNGRELFLHEPWVFDDSQY